MATAETPYVDAVRDQLLERRDRLENALGRQQNQHLSELLSQVDQALVRIDTGDFGVCTVCHGTVEGDRLMRDPLATVCLDCLSPKQQRALEYDLELAARVQNSLLPGPNISIPGWEIAYHYRPAGVVGGDYCDVISDGSGGLYFVVADVAGKGVAAAMLTANLRALLRTLAPLRFPLANMISQANRLFCESKLPMQYATLICGHSTADGKLEIVNAGHLPAFLLRQGSVEVFESVDLPFGMFCDQQFTSVSAKLSPADTVVLFTDGICEAQNGRGDELGMQALRSLFESRGMCCPEDLIDTCRDHVDRFRDGADRIDDETLLALRYTGDRAVATLQ